MESRRRKAGVTERPDVINRTNKKCSKCQIVKPVEDFAFNKSKKDNRGTECKSCDSAYQKERRKQPHAKRVARKWREQYASTEQGKLIQKKGDANRDPVKVKARRAIQNYSVSKNSVLSHISNFNCACGNRAEHWHHAFGYAQKFQLWVVPICSKCHRFKHC